MKTHRTTTLLIQTLKKKEIISLKIVSNNSFLSIKSYICEN